jgi:hypothetical protein
MVYKGHSVVCNYFVTLAYFSYFHNFSKPCNKSILADAELQTLQSQNISFNLKLEHNKL